MKKRISLLLAITMLLSGCNTAEKAEQTTTEITTTTTAETTALTTTTAETTAEMSVAKVTTTTSIAELTVTEITDVETTNFVSEPEINNWYIDGYVIPENWISVMTSEEALLKADELINSAAENTSCSDTILQLMNKNVLAFNTMQLNTFEFYDSLEGIDYQNNEETTVKANSEYFDSSAEIYKLFYETYTDKSAEELFYLDSSKTQPRFFNNDEGDIYLNVKGLGTWTHEPFSFRTYIEITNISNNLCKFTWHYIEYDFWDYEDNRTKELYPHHKELPCYAVKENDQWQLGFMVYDNPELFEITPIYSSCNGEVFYLEDADISQEPFYAYHFTYVHTGGEIFRINEGDEYGDYSIRSARHIFYPYEDEFVEWGGSYQFDDTVTLKGKLETFKYMGEDEPELFLTITVDENPGFPFPYYIYDDYPFQEILIKLGKPEKYSDNDEVMDFVKNKDVHSEEKFSVTLSYLCIAWVDSNRNQSSGYIESINDIIDM